MKYRILIFLVLLISVSFVSAINLDVSVKPISDSYIIDLNTPATYDLVITNKDIKNDSFEIYSLVGVDISPEVPFTIEAGETKIVRINVIPQEALRSKQGYLTFEYLIKNSEDEISKQRLSMNIANLQDSIQVTVPNINPDSQSIKISAKNNIAMDFDDLKIKLDSAFFSYEKDLPLKSLETKEFDIPIDLTKLKTLTAGKYIVDIDVITSGKVASKEATIRFLEQENIESNENDEGFFIKRSEFTKTNLGNVQKIVTISVEKSLIANIFTTYNIPPSRIEKKGFNRIYIWEQDLSPSDQIKVIVKTNWLYPIFIIILAGFLVILIQRYLSTDLIVRKNVYFIKTKGGEFALRVHIKVRAKKFCERIKLTDKIPPLVNLYEKFGAVAPDKIDIANKRVEWNIEALNPGEERIFSYIVYSKIGIVGKFELPSVKALYERDGKIKDIVSNRAFFINKPEKHSI